MRRLGSTRNGKTIVAAFDYRRLAKDGPLPRLLFVAHRKEILTQSRDVFRSVLRDGAFGELLADGFSTSSSSTSSTTPS